MTQTANEQIDTPEAFLEYVRTNGHLLTDRQAQMWTRGTLNMLGVNIDKAAKKKLGNALPPALKEWLYGVFWLAHFRDTALTAHDFLNRIARRSGNTDAQFARYPVTAVFGALKRLEKNEANKQVADSLSPEVRALWDSA